VAKTFDEALDEDSLIIIQYRLERAREQLLEDAKRLVKRQKGALEYDLLVSRWSRRW
jgi:hypothetical protein